MLLTPEEIEARIKLYDDLGVAYKELADLETALPVAPPPQLHVDWEAKSYAGALDAVTRVVLERWPSVREAALFWARAKVELHEDRVRAFETGAET